jgi:GxxExxY protein
MSELIHQDETYRILGACFEVCRDKGCDFLEGVFQACLEIEFRLQDIPAKAQVPMRLEYKGQPLRQHYIADFICYDKVIAELKGSFEADGRTSCPGSKRSPCNWSEGGIAHQLRALPENRT